MKSKLETNPFLQIENPLPLGPGSYEMALQLVEAVNIQPDMRVLEVGGGTGQIAATLAKYWNVSVITLEPWEKLNVIHDYALDKGVENQVLAVKAKAQNLPFADNSFDAVISIGSFFMIGKERPNALKEIIRATRNNGRIGIAEPMCTTNPIPPDIVHFDIMESYRDWLRTINWNCDLFQKSGLDIIESYYFENAHQLWIDNLKYYDGEKNIILQDNGRWLSAGLVVGKKS